MFEASRRTSKCQIKAIGIIFDTDQPLQLVAAAVTRKQTIRRLCCPSASFIFLFYLVSDLELCGSYHVGRLLPSAHTHDFWEFASACAVVLLLDTAPDTLTLSRAASSPLLARSAGEVSPAILALAVHSLETGGLHAPRL